MIKSLRPGSSGIEDHFRTSGHGLYPDGVREEAAEISRRAIEGGDAGTGRPGSITVQPLLVVVVRVGGGRLYGCSKKDELAGVIDRC